MSSNIHTNTVISDTAIDTNPMFFNHPSVLHYFNLLSLLLQIRRDELHFIADNPTRSFDGLIMRNDSLEGVHEDEYSFFRIDNIIIEIKKLGFDNDFINTYIAQEESRMDDVEAIKALASINHDEKTDDRSC